MDGLSQLKGIVAYAVAGLLHWKKMNPSTGDNRQIRDGKRFADFFLIPLHHFGKKIAFIHSSNMFGMLLLVGLPILWTKWC